MDVSVAEAKRRLPELIHAMEEGEKIVITRHGKPVAQLAPPPLRAAQGAVGRHARPDPTPAGMGRDGRRG